MGAFSSLCLCLCTVVGAFHIFGYLFPVANYLSPDGEAAISHAWDNKCRLDLYEGMVSPVSALS